MVKKLVLALAVLFLGFWLFTDPHSLAHATRAGVGQTWALTQQMFGSLIKFFGAL